ncbi:Fc.00g040020.m01.CDS01 [Cosmosporella sp. VM-42]
MSSRVPSLLEPYLALPSEASLILLTSVLGASPSWLVLRSLYSHLRTSEDTGVALVSFLRDGAFWKEGSGKLGLDLDAQAKSNRFIFVDGLTGLFSGAASTPGARKERVLRSSKLADVKKEIESAVAELRTTKKVLIVDQLDALLAVTGEDVTSLKVQEMVLSLRDLVHTTLLTLSADHPLLTSQQTTLEREHANLVLSTAHAADTALALRMLDTGTARDVSGVVRITGSGVKENGGENEFLYHVAADGGVKVFERGT